MRSAMLTTACCSLLLAAPILAQSNPRVIPKRPRLQATADTNNARDYYWYGLSWLTREPEEAAAAFYWAGRLDPAWAEPVYGRFVALLLAQPYSFLNAYMLGRREGRRHESLVAIDSLGYAALTRSPWMNRRIFGAVYAAWIGDDGQVGNGVPRYYRDEHPELGAWLSYVEGKFEESAAQYAEALRKQPDDHMVRFLRAQPFLALGRLDSAVAAVRDAMTALRRSTVDSLNFGYVGYPFLEYSLGHLFLDQNLPDSAQAAYERALLDDLGFAPAHHALGRLHLARADTTAALNELNEALALAGEDPVLLYEIAVLMLATRQPNQVLTLLQRATSAEPFYLPPRLALARLYDISGFTNEAIAEYRTFLQLAPRSMANEITAVRARLSALGA